MRHDARGVNAKSTHRRPHGNLVHVPDDRDVRRPKTPPAGVRAQTATTEPVFDDTTNPQAPLLEQVWQRTGHHTLRLDTLDKGHAELRQALDTVRLDVAEVKGGVNTLVAVAAKASEAEERRRERALDLAKFAIKHRAAIVTALLAGIAGILAAVLR